MLIAKLNSERIQYFKTKKESPENQYIYNILNVIKGDFERIDRELRTDPGLKSLINKVIDALKDNVEIHRTPENETQLKYLIEMFTVPQIPLEDLTDEIKSILKTKEVWKMGDIRILFSMLDDTFGPETYDRKYVSTYLKQHIEG